MEISKVRYYDFNKKIGEERFLAKCSIVLDNCIALHDIRIFNGKKGRYIVMPCKEDVSKYGNTSEKREDVFHPVDKKYFDYMSSIILTGYDIYEKDGEVVYIP